MWRYSRAEPPCITFEPCGEALGVAHQESRHSRRRPIALLPEIPAPQAIEIKRALGDSNTRPFDS